MGYYENKVLAYQLINSMLEKNINQDEIEFVVQTRFGFGKKLVQNYIDSLTKRLAKSKKSNEKDIKSD